MISRHPFLLGFALTLTVLTVIVWGATGGRSYTSLERVEIVSAPPAENDPLAGTGFYSAETVDTVQRVSGFQLGLFPTPQRLLDPHAISVLTLLSIAWSPLLLRLTLRKLRAHPMLAH